MLCDLEMTFLGCIFMETSKATEETSGCTCFEDGDTFSPMARSHFHCHWQSPMVFQEVLSGKIFNTSKPAEPHSTRLTPAHEKWCPQASPQ